MLVRKSVQPVTDGDDVAVYFDSDGTMRNETLRDQPALARRYRKLAKASDDANAQHRAAVDAAHRDRQDRIVAADATLETARRAWESAQIEHASVVKLAADSFQELRDEAVDALVDARAMIDDERAEIDEDAFRMAEDAIAKREKAKASRDDTI